MLAFVLLFPVSASEPESPPSLTWQDYVIDSSISIFLVLFAGLMSGLTVGLLSIDALDLELKLASGTFLERQRSKKVLGIISDHHTLLVTLLVANAIAMETLPIFLDYMFGSVLAIIISVTLVLIFGEILPQALCTGPNQLTIADKMVPLVRCIIILFKPITFPIVLCLDKCFGKDHISKKYKSEDLKTLIALHEYKQGNEHGLSSGQIRIIHGAIDLDKRLARDYMIKLDDVYMIDFDTVLTRPLLHEIVITGFSRIPVYCRVRTNVIGVLLVKRLVGFAPGVSIRDSGIQLRNLLQLTDKVMLLDILNKVQDWGSYLAFITEKEGAERKIVGMLTLKDCLSVVLNTYFLDEDEYDRSPVVPGVRKTQKSVMKSLKRMLRIAPKDDGVDETQLIELN